MVLLCWRKYTINQKRFKGFVRIELFWLVKTGRRGGYWVSKVWEKFERHPSSASKFGKDGSNDHLDKAVSAVSLTKHDTLQQDISDAYAIDNPFSN